MASGSESTCRKTDHCKLGLDDLHWQLYFGKNHPLTRKWLKDVLFMCHYGMRPCGYDH